jgi:hypothetical protein
MAKRVVKLTDSQLTEHFHAVLSEGIQCDCEERQDLKEEFSGSEKEQIRSIIRDFLKMSRSENFETSVRKMVADYVKNDKDLEKYVVDITKNVLVQLYKTMWTKKGFWVNDLKNAAN